MLPVNLCMKFPCTVSLSSTVKVNFTQIISGVKFKILFPSYTKFRIVTSDKIPDIYFLILNITSFVKAIETFLKVNSFLF